MLRKIGAALVAAILLLPALANAQFTPGQVLTAAQLNSAFANVLPTTGGALTGALAVPSLTVTGTPIPVSSGGTGASTATGATGQLQYLQGATGSVARPVTQVFQDRVSVKDFGADSTGSVDSSSAFMAASSASNHVVIPAGTYKISASIVETAAVTFSGAGQGATIIVPTGNFDVFAFSGNVTGGGIYDLTVRGSAMTGGNLISDNGQSRFTLANVQLVGGYNGIYLQDFNKVSLKNVYLNGQTGQYGVKDYGSGIGANNVLDMEDVEIGFGTNTSSSPVGVWIDGDAATTDMRHVAVVKGYRGLQVTNTVGAAMGPSFITAYSFQADYPYDSGIYLDGGTTSTQTHQFMNPYVHGSVSGAGITITSTVRNVVITGGQIDSNYAQGILNNGRYVKISDVQVSNNSASGSAVYPGIELGATSAGTSINGGLAGIWSGYASNLQSYGIAIDSGAIGYSVRGVNLQGNVTAPYVDNSNDAASQIGPNVATTTTVSRFSGPLSVAGSITHSSQEVDKATAFSAPASGATVTLGTGIETAIILPSSTLAALTVTLPSCTTAYDGSIARYSSLQAITALTVSATSGTVSGAPSSLAASAGNAYLCRGSATTWYRLY